METFSTLVGSLLALGYHCFDRIVVQGYLTLLTRPEHIVHFFRDVHDIYPITKQALAKRTQEYQHWVEAFARHHRIPVEWPDDKALKKKGRKREAYVRPYGAAMERRNRFGVSCIFKSLEQGPTFRARLAASSCTIPTSATRTFRTPISPIPTYRIRTFPTRTSRTRRFRTRATP